MGMNRTSICRATRIFLAAALSLIAVAEAKAFEVTAEQRAACTPDAFRLCSSEIPDVGRIVACMRAKQASLSAPCRAVFQTASLSRSIPSHQRRAYRADTTYANYQAPASAGHRSRQAFQVLPSSRHRTHRVFSTYANYQEPSSFLGGRWMHAHERREALIIARKIMVGFAMACQNHSIPDDLCNFSAESADGRYGSYNRWGNYRGGMPGLDSFSAWGGSESASHAQPEY